MNEDSATAVASASSKAPRTKQSKLTTQVRQKKASDHPSSVMHLFEDLESPMPRGPGGRKRIPLLDQISVYALRRGDNAKVYRCMFAPQGCSFSRAAPRKQTVWLTHGSECSFAPQTLREKCIEEQAKNAPVVQAESEASGPSTKRQRTLDSSIESPDPCPTETTTHNSAAQNPSSKTFKVLSHSELQQPSVLSLSRKARREKLKAKLDYLILKYFVISSSPLSHLNLQEFKDIFREAAPEYTPPCASTMEDTLIPRQAAHVRVEMNRDLRKECNLTLTFDGNTSRAQESVYTVHVTTPERRVFLVEGNSASAKSHTAEYIFDVLKEVRHL